MAPLIGMIPQGGQVIGSPTLMQHNPSPTLLDLIFPTRMPRPSKTDRRNACRRRREQKQEKKRRKTQRRLKRAELRHDFGLSRIRIYEIETRDSNAIRRQQKQQAIRTAKAQKLLSDNRRKQTRADMRRNLDHYIAIQDARQIYDKESMKRTKGLWGFDPIAGLKSSPAKGWNLDTGCYVRHGHIRNRVPNGQYEVDYLGRITGKRFVRGWQWGVETGGPGKEGFFGHGILKKRQQVAIPADPHGEVAVCHRICRVKPAKSEKMQWPDAHPDSSKWWLKRAT